MNNIKNKVVKSVCLLLVVCFSIIAIPHTFASAETSSPCPFELGDTIKLYDSQRDSYLHSSTGQTLKFSDPKDSVPKNADFEVIDTYDDGSFCLGYSNFGDHNVVATRHGLEGKSCQDPTQFLLEDAGNGQYYLKVASGKYSGKYVHHFSYYELELNNSQKTPLTIIQ